METALKGAKDLVKYSRTHEDAHLRGEDASYSGHHLTETEAEIPAVGGEDFRGEDVDPHETTADTQLSTQPKNQGQRSGGQEKKSDKCTSCQEMGGRHHKSTTNPGRSE